MAQLVALRVYQINSMDPIPASNVPLMDFPFAGIFVRAANSPGTTGLKLSTGTIVYSQIQLVATGATYLVLETPAAIQALS